MAAIMTPSSRRPPANGKNIAPRVAALLDVMQISDILSVESADTFTRPIYAGNAIATVKVVDAKLVITVRGTAFAKAAKPRRFGQRSKPFRVPAMPACPASSAPRIAKLERPELTSPRSSSRAVAR
jgi:electron transfer flavoprotein alpha subunit